VKAGILFEEFLAYTEEENQRWKQFFLTHPQALDLPLDIAGTVRELVQHIFAVDLFFASLVTRQSADPNQAPARTLKEMFAAGEKAASMYRGFFVQATPEQWEERIELSRIGLKASRRKMVAQALTHSVRHWAQIATFLRQQGFKQDWNHDFLLSKAME